MTDMSDDAAEGIYRFGDSFRAGNTCAHTHTQTHSSVTMMGRSEGASATDDGGGLVDHVIIEWHFQRHWWWLLLKRMMMNR